MNNSSLGGGFLSGPTGGILDLGSPFHQHQPTQLGHPSGTSQQHMNMMGGLESDHHPIGLMEVKGSNMKFNFGKGKAMVPSNPTNSNDPSEEDEPSYAEDGNCENFDGGKSKTGSPWQRMKWTDNVVRLLIGVVACVGDDGTIDGMDGPKRKSGIWQKKGKWKTVSKIMISKGCHVSPQQCEDKFNDLNKRYKRLNDILGRGTSCRVFENPALLESMPNLSAKAKDDVRKILSSKHLFYKEMCAHHNGQRIPNCHDLNLQGYSMQDGRDNDGSDEENINESDEDDELGTEGNNNSHGDGDGMEEFCDRKKSSEEDGHFWPQCFGLDKFEAEMGRIFQDPTKSLWERREWLKMQRRQVQEQSVSYQAQALELEKQRFKWLRYCSKKNRELERLRLENERMKLENERKVLQLKQKELETDFRMDPPSSSLGIERLQASEGNQLGETALASSWHRRGRE